MDDPLVRLAASVEQIATRWRAARDERQSRRHLDPDDFAELREAGLLRAAAPVASGGSWVDTATSTRPLGELYRSLARADPSVALVSVMHPAVLGFWLCSPDPAQPDWEDQRAAVFASAVDGKQWGTITSEPGSGGDIAKTRSLAVPADGDSPLPGRRYAVTGDKHFGSGSGVTDFMMTTAVPEGEADPTIFVLHVRDRPWDGSAGLHLTAPWDGMGMAATQSHAMRLEGAPAVRLAWDGPLDTVTRTANPLVTLLFTAVVLGVLDEAVATASARLDPRAGELRPFETVEWTRARADHWLAVQAYEGALRSLAEPELLTRLRSALTAKLVVAELAEQCLGRLARVLGGGTFSARSPFAHWFEDVRALGFLRPPWALTYDALAALPTG